jgi:hypothetical protein
MLKINGSPLRQLQVGSKISRRSKKSGTYDKYKRSKINTTFEETVKAAERFKNRELQ